MHWKFFFFSDQQQGQFWHSSIITKRVGSWIVETSSGTRYQLIDKMTCRLSFEYGEIIDISELEWVESKMAWLYHVYTITVRLPCVLYAADSWS